MIVTTAVGAGGPKYTVSNTVIVTEGGS